MSENIDLKPLTDAQAEISRLAQRVAELETAHSRQRVAEREAESRPLGDPAFIKDQLAIILKERNDLALRCEGLQKRLTACVDAAEEQRAAFRAAMQASERTKKRLDDVLDAAERERAVAGKTLQMIQGEREHAKRELAHLRELIEGIAADNCGQFNSPAFGGRVVRTLDQILREPDDFMLCWECAWPIRRDADRCPICGHVQPREVGPVADKVQP